MAEKKMKEYKFGMAWQVYGLQGVMVPVDFTEKQAQQYVMDHWDEIPLPEGDYVEGSDEPDFESARFVELAE